MSNTGYLPLTSLLTTILGTPHKSLQQEVDCVIYCTSQPWLHPPPSSSGFGQLWASNPGPGFVQIWASFLPPPPPPPHATTSIILTHRNYFRAISYRNYSNSWTWFIRGGLRWQWGKDKYHTNSGINTEMVIHSNQCLGCFAEPRSKGHSFQLHPCASVVRKINLILT